MLRITVTNAAAERWAPVIGHHFRMTLAPHEKTLRSLSVQLVAPRADDPAAVYECAVFGRAASGIELSVRSRHEDADLAIGHAFARARRELRRGRLRAGMVS